MTSLGSRFASELTSLWQFAFRLPRAMLTTLWLPLTVLFAAYVIFPTAEITLVERLVGAILVLPGVHLLLFRRQHALAHVAEMRQGAETAVGADRFLYRDGLAADHAVHLYAYGGVLLTFIGLVLVLAR